MRESFRFEKSTKRPEKQLEKLPENVSILDLPEARYRFLYENHQLTHSPEELGNAEALVHEDIYLGDYSDPQVATKKFDGILERDLERKTLPDRETARANIIKFEAHLEARKIPQYLIDVVDPHREYIHLLEKGQQLLNAEGVVGSAVMGYAAAQAVDQKKMSRRSFLTGLAGAALAGKQGLNLMLVSEDEITNKKLSTAAKAGQSLNETVSPELPGIMITYRNAIWAIKLHRIAKDLQERSGGKKPEIAMRLGRMHSGVEEMLQKDPKEVLDYIKKTSQILSKFVYFGPDGVMISPMAKLEYNENTQTWEASEAGRDKELEAIERSLDE